MRLLHLGENNRLLTTNFSGQTIPPYAILSHRWGEEEVLLEHLEDTKCEKKSGYRKVEFCAEQGARHGLQYFWIDTCCIDKYNIAERSKAINSMYRWYRDAARCYVFLQDVTASTVEPSQHGSWKAQLKASDWFTRGWTLQELLAPASVEFYSSSGQSLGTRESLKQLIHDITSIPIEALQGRPLAEFSVRDRMAWAHTRRTTQPEDYAHCQIGLLNVHLHLDYGEGRERALGRLQEEVEAVGAAPCSIPYCPNEPFLDHHLQLEKIEASLFTSKHTTNIVITGKRGTGRSRLALELAHRMRRRDRSCPIFWIDASDIDSLKQAYTDIAQRLDIPGWDESDMGGDIRQLVKNHLDRYTSGSWLLIFDNADEVKLRSTATSMRQSASLTDFLPESSSGSIIFTTNNDYLAEHLSTPIMMELQTMNAGHCEQVLLNCLFNRTRASEGQELKLLVEELALVPLAIVQAAAYINKRGSELKDYRALIVARKDVALGLSSRSSDADILEYDRMNPIILTLLVTLDHLYQHHRLAADILYLAACVDRKDIPVELFQSALPREREDAIGILKAYGLVTRRPAESALELHQLTQVAVRRWLEEQGWLTHWDQQAVQRLLEIYPHVQIENELGYRSKWRRLWPHVKLVLSHYFNGEDDEAKTTLAWRFALALAEDGRDGEAEALDLRVKERRVRVLGPDHPDTLTSMSNLAHIYQKQGRWKDAEQLNLELRDTRLRVLGPEHPDTLLSVGNLATNYGAQGRLKEAENLEVQVLEARKRVLGSKDPKTLDAMANLTVTYCLQERLKEAKEMGLQVWDLRKRVLGPEHPDTLISMSNLATIFGRLKQYEDGIRFTMEVKRIRMRLLGVEHPSTLISMSKVAEWYAHVGRWEQAVLYFIQVGFIRQRVLGPEHPDTLDTSGQVATAFWGSGRRVDAINTMQQTVRIGQRTLEADNCNLVF